MSILDQNKNEKLFENILENKNKNEKVFESFDEETFSEMGDESEDTEFHATCSARSMNVDTVDQPEFEINRFFNELPIRILNSHQMPFFYAEDVSKVLGLRSVESSVRNFDEDEIVSQELRQKYNITTYKKYKNAFRRDNKIILLTEFGVYRMLMNSKSQKAIEFKKFVYDVLHQLRTVGEYKIKAKLEQLETINETLLAENGLLKQTIDNKDKKLSQFKNLCDEITLIEFPNNPYEIVPTNIPKHLKKKSGDCKEHSERKKHNSIDHPIPHALSLSYDLGITFEMQDASTYHYSERKTIHANNVLKAHQFIRDNAPHFSYLVTSKPTPEQLSAGTVVHKIYVKDIPSSMKKLSQLSDFKPINASSRSNWYTCDKEKIIDVLNAIAD